jgi:hypothetical protein
MITRRYVAALLIWAVFAPASPSLQSDRATDDARIAGRVLTESGTAVEGAQVSALLFSSQPQKPPERYSAITGPDGGYVIERLPGGRFRVFAEKTGYSNLVVQERRIDGGRFVNLEPSRAASGIDLVVRRTGSIAGRVTRPDGTAVLNARVMSQIRLSNGRLAGTGPDAMTDTNGRYLLDGVPPGTYAITAMYSVLNEMLRKPVPTEYQDWARTFHPDTSDFDRATPITIQGGERLEDIDITLQQEARHQVSGVVVAENGSALRNIRLEYASTTGLSGIVLRLGDEGQFSVGGVRGSVALLATAESNGRELIGVTHVTATSSVENGRIVLGAPARVRGRVVFAGEAPPPERSLQVQFATDWHRPLAGNGLPDIVPVDGNNRFSSDSIIGELRVVLLGLMPDWDLKEFRRGGTALPEGRLILANGQVVDDLEIIVARRH